MKTLAIVGTHPLTRDHAPYEDKDVDILVFNSAPLADWCKRVTISLELHGAEEYTNPIIEASGYWDWLQKQDKSPVYMREIDPRVEMCKQYPLDEIVNLYLKNFKRADRINKYFTSSPCYAIALGIYLGYERIEFYGIEMESNSEYIYQRDGVGLWLGIAVGLGVEVVLPEATSMFNAPLYGFDDIRTGIRREDFEEQILQLQTQEQEVWVQLKQAEGEKNAIIDEMNSAVQKGINEGTRKRIGTRYQEALARYDQLLNKHSFLAGQIGNSQGWLTTIDKMTIAAGDAQKVMALNSQKIRSQDVTV